MPGVRLLALLSIALVCGACGRDESGSAELRSLGKFADAMVQPSPSDPEQLTFVGSVASTEAVSGQEAVAALMMLTSPSCPGGGGVSFDPMPALRSQLDRMHAAGTRFEARYVCEGALPEEFPASAGAPEAEVTAKVREKLRGGTDFDPQRHVISPLSYGELVPKYRALDTWLGGLVSSRLRRCEGRGVNIGRVVLAVYPLAPVSAEHPIPRAPMIAGAHVECAHPAAVTPAPGPG